MDGSVARRIGSGDAPSFGAPFSYEEAFSRNLGWLTEWEQQALRHKRVAIAGMGGVGGVHLLTLARFGVGAFNIADLDRFELANFNRQVGATLDTIGKPKVEVLAENARKINPELRIACFDRGVDEQNMDAFLAGADLYIDALDFFVLDIRRKLTDRCLALGIPVINAAPLGMGTAFLVFKPGGMSFEQWFRLEGLSEEQQYVNYLLGMAPAGLHRQYLADPSRVDLRGRRGPSTPAACELCAGVAAVEAVKLLLGRGIVRAVPHYHQFDAFRGRWIVRKLRWGNGNPRQRLKIALTRRIAARLSRQAATVEPAPAARTEIEKILDFARWAPSGDNCQPWRFEVVDEERVTVHLTDQTDHDIYDYRDGEPTLLAGGMLLESMRIAASAWGRRVDWHYEGRQGHVHRISIRLPKAVGLAIDPLVSQISLRSVDRRRYRLQPLADEQKQALAAALGKGFEIEWHETMTERWALARLGGHATAVRLSAPEAFPIHQAVLDWAHRQSPRGIPAAAAGLSRLSLVPMRWAMRKWWRMRLLNRLGGLTAAAVEMDYVPGLCSAAFFAVRMKFAAANFLSDHTPAHVVGLINAGQAIQRFWLTATSLGLAVQPTMATLIFAHYGEHDPSFTSEAKVRRRAAALATAARARFGADNDLVFLGRIGVPQNRPKLCRSTRRPLSELLSASDPSA